jgi:hypothetical protein
MTLKQRTAVLMIPSIALFFLGACGGENTGINAGAGAGTFASLDLDAEYSEPFSSLMTVREMEDGTVMAADPLSQVLLRVDMASNTADTLGRVGGGPQEYRQPDQVFPLPADSTLLVDLGKGQLTVVDPRGTFHTGMKMTMVEEGSPILLVQPRFVDQEGRLYFEGGFWSGDQPQDSIQISRYDRTTGETRGLGWTWRTPPIVTRMGEGIRTRQVQMAPRDDWAVAPDGSVAFVRANGYQVEWHLPDGQVVIGPPNPVETPALTDEDKYAYFQAPAPAGLRVTVFRGSDGAADMSMTRAGGGSRSRDEIDLTAYEWADRYPPFQSGRASVSPDGRLWVRRWLNPEVSPVMDVFDRAGEKLGSVELPLGRRLVGWGSTGDGDPAIYLVRTDEFDLKWLERYRIVQQGAFAS